MLCGCFTAGGNEIVVADDLRRMNPFWMSVSPIEMRFDPFEHRLFRRGRIALEPRLREFEVLHDQVESTLRGDNQRIRGRNFVFADDIARLARDKKEPELRAAYSHCNLFQPAG